MTIVSLSRGFALIKTRKTASTSIEEWLAPVLSSGDFVTTSSENRVTVGFWSTRNIVSAAPRIEKFAKSVLRRVPGSPRGISIREHMSVTDVRKVIGDHVWQSLYTFCVERDPWDRTLSLWKWRQQRLGQAISFDAYLDLMEESPTDKLVRDFSNYGLYSENGKVAVSRVIPFRHLSKGLQEVAQRLNLPVDVRDLPFRKAGLRSEEDSAAHLSPQQVDRIARLCRDEIVLFGWDYADLHVQPRRRNGAR